MDTKCFGNGNSLINPILYREQSMESCEDKSMLEEKELLDLC